MRGYVGIQSLYTIDLQRDCDHCGQPYQPRAANQRYCTSTCSRTARYLRRPSFSKVCKHCNSAFESYDKKAKFCTRKCAAIHNNTIHPKRKPSNNCLRCDRGIPKRRKLCSSCAEVAREERRHITLGELQGEAKYQRNARVRGLARYVMKTSGIPKVCRVCGYDRHVEVSHIRAINTFPEDALVADINSIDNLEYLCPNHHWEHEAGIL